MRLAAPLAERSWQGTAPQGWQRTADRKVLTLRRPSRSSFAIIPSRKRSSVASAAAIQLRKLSGAGTSWTIAHLRSMGGGSLWFPASWIIRILQPVWRARCRCRRQADSLELAAPFLVRTTCARVSNYSQARRTGLRERTGESRSAGTVPRGGGKNLLDESGCVGVKRVWSR